MVFQVVWRAEGEEGGILILMHGLSLLASMHGLMLGLVHGLVHGLMHRHIHGLLHGLLHGRVCGRMRGRTYAYHITNIPSYRDKGGAERFRFFADQTSFAPTKHEAYRRWGGGGDRHTQQW